MKVMIHENNRGQALAMINEHLLHLNPAKSYVVTIGQWRETRSLEQNSKFHALAGELAEVLGYTQEELKRAVKKELGFYAIVDGRLGKMYRWESSADWDTVKMSKAIELLNLWAIECDHVWRFEQ